MAVCSTTALRKYLTQRSNLGQPLREKAVSTTRGHAEGETLITSGAYRRPLFKSSLGPIPLRCKLILSGSQLDHLFAKLLLDGRGGVSKVHRSPAHEGQKGHREAEAPVQASCLAWLRTRDHRNVPSSEHSASPGGWRWRHPVEIREAYGYRTFDAPGL